MKVMILGNALDTNGQNARYAEASRKHGKHERVLKALAIGNYDPAGVVERFRMAAEGVEGLEIRAAHRSQAYFDFPVDLVWSRHNDHVIRKLAHDADVIHLNNDTIAAKKFRLRKPMLLHHHGSLFRNNPARLLMEARNGRMVQAVSTVDLMRVAPEILNWLPTAYDIKALKALRRKRKPDGRVRIVHAPTNRAGKHTELFLEAVRQLQEEGLPIDLILVENKTNAECLAIKATADIVYDQLMWGYGCNSVEAWGMGIPVISGADEWTTQKMQDMWGYLPYENATERTLKDVIRRMVMSEDVRSAAGRRGHTHVLRYHDEVPALERLVELYQEAIKTYYSPRIPGKGDRPVTFMYRPRRRVWAEDQLIDFGPDGRVTIEDPYVIELLRRRQSSGIEEVA